MTDHMQAAIEAAESTIELHDHWSYSGQNSTCDCGENLGHDIDHVTSWKAQRAHQAQSTITAALPHIRATIAQEISTISLTAGSHKYATGYFAGLERAAQIAKGEAE